MQISAQARSLTRVPGCGGAHQVPYDVGFAPPKTESAIDAFEYIIDAIFVVDIIGCFFTAIVDTNARLITGAAAAVTCRRPSRLSSFPQRSIS